MVLFRYKKRFAFRVYGYLLFNLCLAGILLPAPAFSQVFRGYYSDGKVKFRSARDKNKQVIRGYYPSGALEFIAVYERGELDGTVREYFENGFLKAEIPYKENRRHGLAKFYHENGMLLGKIEYRRGKETGETKFYDENGLFVASSPRLRWRVRRAMRYENVHTITGSGEADTSESR
jgi:hypothetical protein